MLRRRQRWSSLRISQHATLPVRTDVGFLRRRGVKRLARREPPRLAQRSERRRPGSVVHLDVKQLGKLGRVGHRMHGSRTTRVIGRLLYEWAYAQAHGPSGYRTRAVPT